MSDETVVEDPTQIVEGDVAEVTAAEEAPAEDAAPVAEETTAEAPAEDAAPAAAEPVADATPKPAPKPSKDARYQATGKRKTAVARVILTPGKGTFWVNGRDLNEYFPRNSLRTEVMKPLNMVGAGDSYHVRARLHGGGTSAQAGALRHGIARALAEINQDVRSQLKGAGLLSLDARQVERKKAGLKKARKRPQFSKR